MPRYVAFLRAINVGGHHLVKMEDLKKLFEKLGFKDVETFIASGNVIFETGGKDRRGIENKIEAALEKTLSYEVVTFVRTTAEVVAIAGSRPFTASAMATAAALNVGLLKEPLAAPARTALAGLKTAVDDFATEGPEVFWICKERQSNSKITNNVLERALKGKATFRGMKTMERLAAKYK